MDEDGKKDYMLRSIKIGRLKKKKQTNFFGIYVLIALTVAIWLIGCILIGYMSWVLATSMTVKQFLSGNLIFTYVVVGFGFLLFALGLLGWVGATSISGCILRTYVMATILAVAFEVGGILTMSILRMDVEDIIEHGWGQVNQGTRNILQNHFRCCGFTGPKEFAYRNDPIDDTCYETVASTETTEATSKNNNSVVVDGSDRHLKQHGCGLKLKNWFENNQNVWIPVICSIGSLQILGVLCAICVIHTAQRRRRKRLREIMEASSSSRNGFQSSNS